MKSCSHPDELYLSRKLLVWGLFLNLPTTAKTHFVCYLILSKYGIYFLRSYCKVFILWKCYQGNQLSTFSWVSVNNLSSLRRYKARTDWKRQYPRHNQIESWSSGYLSKLLVGLLRHSIGCMTALMGSIRNLAIRYLLWIIFI